MGAENDSSSLPAINSFDKGLDNTIITIDGYDYNAQEFMNRVLDYTIESDPIKTIKTDNGSNIKFEYNKFRQRSKKITDKGTIAYNYNELSNLKSEILPDKNHIEYSYKIIDNLNVAESIFYQNNRYYYIINNNGIITGLLDNNNQVICEYSYDKNGITKHIYEINGNKRIMHQDNTGDDFVGCVNSLRYDGNCYDSETGMFCLDTGSYYDAKTNKLVGSECHVDMKGLFGDQYQTLSKQQSLSNSIVTLSIPSSLQQQLIYSATQKYNNTLNENIDSYSTATWYQNFSGSSMQYKLAARIIYAENSYNTSETIMNNALQYNRQGIAWEITNRLLEDNYRDSKGKTLFFSTTKAPSLYSVLTKKDAFTSINGSNAKGPMDPSKIAYQQAFYLACLISVASGFDQWDAVVPRPKGITSQCYNKGKLKSTSSPNSEWKNVKFPGFTRDYSDDSDYSAFAYYSTIGKFNILHSYDAENLYIDSVYY